MESEEIEIISLESLERSFAREDERDTDDLYLINVPNKEKQKMSQKERLEKLENAKLTLKKEFIGIDKQIDQLIGSVKSWYIFPQLRRRPTIVNLWGITGTFKTSVVRRLVELLDLKDDTREQDARKVKTLGFVKACLNEELFKEHGEEGMIGQPEIFIIDEIQNAKTMDQEGNDAKNAENLADFFSLLSDGKIVQKRDEWEVRSFKYLKDTISSSPETFINKVNEKVREKHINSSKYYDDLLKKCNTEEAKKQVNEDREHSINSINFLSVIWEEHSSKLRDVGITYKELLNKTPQDLIDFVITKITNISLDITYDFSKVLIFNLGNLDNLFGMLTLAVDSESISPDEFYQLTKNVSFVDAKRCLLYLFKPEQVSRLGSNHIIFPSFNSEMYFKLIEKLNKSLISDAKSEGIKVKIDKSLNNMVFGFGAVPSQGSRALISTHETLIKLPVTEAITECILTKKKEARLGVNRDGDITIQIGRKTKVFTNMLINRDETPPKIGDLAIMVHEAGHAVVATAVMGLYPSKITVVEGHGYGGYVMPNKRYNPELVDRQFFVNRIAISMAGRVAEEIFFGEDGTNAGASSDIENATKTATVAVKVYGLGDSHDSRSGFASMFLPEDATIRSFIESDDIDAENLIKEGTLLAYNILDFYKKEHNNLVKALKKRPEMEEEEIGKVLKMR